MRCVPENLALAHGGAVTQLTSKATAVTLNDRRGTITTHNANLVRSTQVSFTVTNNTVVATDDPDVWIKSSPTSGVYDIWVSAVAAGSFNITLRNNNNADLAQAVVICFKIEKVVKN